MFHFPPRKLFCFLFFLLSASVNFSLFCLITLFQIFTFFIVKLSSLRRNLLPFYFLSEIFFFQLMFYQLEISLQISTRCEISFINILPRSVLPDNFRNFPSFSRVRLIATGDTRFFHSRMHPRPRYVVTIRTLICVSSRSAYPRPGVLFYCVLLRFESLACLSRTFFFFFRNFLITDVES